MRDNKYKDLLQRKQNAQQMDGQYRNYVNQVSGISTRPVNQEARGSLHLTDDQNKLIDMQNLRK